MHILDITVESDVFAVADHASSANSSPWPLPSRTVCSADHLEPAKTGVTTDAWPGSVCTARRLPPRSARPWGERLLTA